MKNINNYHSTLSATIDNEINNCSPFGSKWLQKSFHNFKAELENYITNSNINREFWRIKLIDFLELIQKYENWYNEQYAEREKYFKETTAYFKENGLLEERIIDFFKDINHLPDCVIVTTLTSGDYDFYTEHGILNEAVKATKKLIFSYFPEMAKPPQSTTNSTIFFFTRQFTDTEREHIFNGLISGGFIPKDTNRNHFNYVFGGMVIPDNEKPFKPIQWLKNKQRLRELLTSPKVKNVEVLIAEIERNTPLCFIDAKNNALCLAKNKKVQQGETTPIDYRLLQKILATL